MAKTWEGSMFRTITSGLLLCATTSLGAQTMSKTVVPAPKPAVQKNVKAPQHESMASLRKAAKITMTQARATALKEVPNGRVRDGELEREDGKLIYSFDIAVKGKSGVDEVQIDAITGAVVSNKHESPRAEAAEKKMERKEKK
ncbi:MAG: PepSY domain-containing protein [Gemmatimonadaceae bacterium]